MIDAMPNWREAEPPSWTVMCDRCAWAEEIIECHNEEVPALLPDRDWRYVSKPLQPQAYKVCQGRFWERKVIDGYYDFQRFPPESLSWR